jgi:nuclear pore complex protein Nup85
VFASLADEIPVSLLDPSASQTKDDADSEMDESVFDGGAARTTTALDRSIFSSRLAFLARYRDFHALYARGELGTALVLLVSLFANNAAPKRFQAVMLLDSVPLLEGKRVFQSSSLVLTADWVSFHRPQRDLLLSRCL